jgi:hypothetical protein
MNLRLLKISLGKLNTCMRRTKAKQFSRILGNIRRKKKWIKGREI